MKDQTPNDTASATQFASDGEDEFDDGFPHGVTNVTWMGPDHMSDEERWSDDSNFYLPRSVRFPVPVPVDDPSNKPAEQKDDIKEDTKDDFLHVEVVMEDQSSDEAPSESESNDNDCPKAVDEEFINGFTDCMNEALKFLVEVEGLPLDHPVVQGLYEHLSEERSKILNGVARDSEPKKETSESTERENDTKKKSRSRTEPSPFGSGEDLSSCESASTSLSSLSEDSVSERFEKTNIGSPETCNLTQDSSSSTLR